MISSSCNGIIFRISNLSILFLYFIIMLSVCTSQSHKFYSKNTLDDGVHEINLFFNGIRVKESTAGPKEGSPSGIVVRQLSNGRQVVNLIYNGVPPYLHEEEGNPFEDLDESLVGTDEEGLKLRECLVEKSRKEVKKFVEEFDNNAENLRLNVQEISDTSIPSNFTYISLENGGISSNISEHLFAITQFKSLKHKCFNLNRKIRKLMKYEKRQRLKMESRQNETILNRNRRGIRELLILPGTKWCGNGRLAKSYNDIDGYMEADHCCRTHDLCPSSIPRFSRKFGLYNYRLTTISHCSCDKRFKTCLKQIGTGAAGVVGNVFFRLVKASCFDFKKKKVCKKRGFWSCLKWGYEKQAVIRNPISWNT